MSGTFLNLRMIVGHAAQIKASLSDPISCQIEFVFTEEIELKVGEMPSALLLESSDSMLQERQEGLILTADQGD